LRALDSLCFISNKKRQQQQEQQEALSQKVAKGSGWRVRVLFLQKRKAIIRGLLLPSLRAPWPSSAAPSAAPSFLLVLHFYKLEN
jgi:hypothetical protein